MVVAVYCCFVFCLRVFVVVLFACFVVVLVFFCFRFMLCLLLFLIWYFVVIVRFGCFGVSDVLDCRFAVVVDFTVNLGGGLVYCLCLIFNVWFVSDWFRC